MQGMERPKEPGLRSLRTVRELQEGMVLMEILSFLLFILPPAKNNGVEYSKEHDHMSFIKL